MSRKKTQEANPNNNCLDGKRCPNCGSWGPFELVVSMRVLLYDNGAEDAENGSIEYDGRAPAVCNSCGYQDVFAKFDDK